MLIRCPNIFFSPSFGKFSELDIFAMMIAKNSSYPILKHCKINVQIHKYVFDKWRDEERLTSDSFIYSVQESQGE